jgi:hypothetical protein
MSDEYEMAIVDIVDVFSKAERIDIRDLRITDKVFDIFGNEYTLTKVKHYKHWVRFIRSDGEPTFLYYSLGTMTVIR